MIIRSIAAIDKNNVIGKNNSLPWSYPKDKKFYRNKVKNETVIVGRKTFESGSQRTDRNNIILTKNTDLSSENPKENYVNSVDEALEFAESLDEDLVYVIGGQEIYELFMDKLDEMILTHINESYNGDTYYPEFDENNWDTKILQEYDDLTIVHYYRK